jgi:hypothetical protein
MFGAALLPNSPTPAKKPQLLILNKQMNCAHKWKKFSKIFNFASSTNKNI